MSITGHVIWTGCAPFAAARPRWSLQFLEICFVAPTYAPRYPQWFCACSDDLGYPGQAWSSTAEATERCARGIRDRSASCGAGVLSCFIGGAPFTPAPWLRRVQLPCCGVSVSVTGAARLAEHGWCPLCSAVLNPDVQCLLADAAEVRYACVLVKPGGRIPWCMPYWCARARTVSEVHSLVLPFRYRESVEYGPFFRGIPPQSCNADHMKFRCWLRGRGRHTTWCRGSFNAGKCAGQHRRFVPSQSPMHSCVSGRSCPGGARGYARCRCAPRPARLSRRACGWRFVCGAQPPRSPRACPRCGATSGMTACSGASLAWYVSP